MTVVLDESVTELIGFMGGCNVFRRNASLISYPAAITEALRRVVGTTALAAINVTNVTRRRAWMDVVTSPGYVHLEHLEVSGELELNDITRCYRVRFRQLLRDARTARKSAPLFLLRHGWFRNRRMPTGATFSSAVATSTTHLLLSGLEHPEVVIRHNIDNVRMAGPRH